jgi:YHS domain-containing protein
METETRLKKMHGTIQSTPDSAALAEKMVIDPVCRMTIDPAAAAARELFEGKPVYFCSEGCRQRLLRRSRAASRNAVRSQPAMICGG